MSERSLALFMRLTYAIFYYSGRYPHLGLWRVEREFLGHLNDFSRPLRQTMAEALRVREWLARVVKRVLSFHLPAASSTIMGAGRKFLTHLNDFSDPDPKCYHLPQSNPHSWGPGLEECIKLPEKFPSSPHNRRWRLIQERQE